MWENKEGNFSMRITAMTYYLLMVTTFSCSSISSAQEIDELKAKARMLRGIYNRVESDSSPTNEETIWSTLGEIIGDQIKDIQITEFYSGWGSVNEAKKQLLDKLASEEVQVCSSRLWNLDIPIQLAGVIEYKDGSKGIIAVAQHRVGFQDNSGESWYFQWDERAPEEWEK